MPRVILVNVMIINGISTANIDSDQTVRFYKLIKELYQTLLCLSRWVSVVPWRLGLYKLILALAVQINIVSINLLLIYMLLIYDIILFYHTIYHIHLNNIHSSFILKIFNILFYNIIIQKKAFFIIIMYNIVKKTYFYKNQFFYK